MEFMRVPFRSSRTSAFGPVAGLLVETTRVRELRVVGHDAIGEAFGDRAEQSATTADEDDGRQGRCRTKPALDLARNLALGLLYGRTDRTGDVMLLVPEADGAVPDRGIHLRQRVFVARAELEIGRAHF